METMLSLYYFYGGTFNENINEIITRLERKRIRKMNTVFERMKRMFPIFILELKLNQSNKVEDILNYESRKQFTDRLKDIILNDKELNTKKKLFGLEKRRWNPNDRMYKWYTQVEQYDIHR